MESLHRPASVTAIPAAPLPPMIRSVSRLTDRRRDGRLLAAAFGHIPLILVLKLVTVAAAADAMSGRYGADQMWVVAAGFAAATVAQLRVFWSQCTMGRGQRRGSTRLLVLSAVVGLLWCVFFASGAVLLLGESSSDRELVPLFLAGLAYIVGLNALTLPSLWRDRG